MSGLVVWLIILGISSSVVVGVLMGIASGIIIILAIKELLPTAHRYDGSDALVTYSFKTGMLIVGIVLKLLERPK